MLFFGVSKVTGLARGILVGRRFGAGDEFDAFTAANQLPELFFVLIAGGALAAAFIPVYTEYLTDEDLKEANRLLHSTISLVILIMAIVCGIGAIFAYPLADLLAPGFELEKRQLMGELMRVLLFQNFLFGISGVMTSFLNAHQHFALPALASVALDIGYVIGLYALADLGIMGLAWGTVIGAAIHILIQVPALIQYRFTYLPVLDWRQAGVREIIRLMGPRIVTLGTIQFADLFIIRLASGLAVGSTSAYFYGYFIMQLPETLFGTAVAMVVFPTMSELYNRGDIEGLKRLAMNTLGIIWTLTIPSAIGILLLGRPAISLLFEQGAFDAATTLLVYGTLIPFSFRVVSEGSLEILARLLYAQHDTFRPMFAYLVWLAAQIGFAYLLVGALGVQGLALASTIAFTILSLILYGISRYKIGPLGIESALVSGGRAVAAAFAMGAVIWGISLFITSPLPFLAISLAIGGGIFLLVHWLLGGRELAQLVTLLFARRQVAE